MFAKYVKEAEANISFVLFVFESYRVDEKAPH